MTPRIVSTKVRLDPPVRERSARRGRRRVLRDRRRSRRRGRRQADRPRSGPRHLLRGQRGSRCITIETAEGEEPPPSVVASPPSRTSRPTRSASSVGTSRRPSRIADRSQRGESGLERRAVEVASERQADEVARSVEPSKSAPVGWERVHQADPAESARRGRGCSRRPTAGLPTAGTQQVVRLTSEPLCKHVDGNLTAFTIGRP